MENEACVVLTEQLIIGKDTTIGSNTIDFDEESKAIEYISVNYRLYQIGEYGPILYGTGDPDFVRKEGRLVGNTPEAIDHILKSSSVWRLEL